MKGNTMLQMRVPREQDLLTVRLYSTTKEHNTNSNLYLFFSVWLY